MSNLTNSMHPVRLHYSTISLFNNYRTVLLLTRLENPTWMKWNQMNFKQCTVHSFVSNLSSNLIHRYAIDSHPFILQTATYSTGL